MEWWQYAEKASGGGGGKGSVVGNRTSYPDAAQGRCAHDPAGGGLCTNGTAAAYVNVLEPLKRAVTECGKRGRFTR